MAQSRCDALQHKCESTWVPAWSNNHRYVRCRWNTVTAGQFASTRALICPRNSKVNRLGTTDEYRMKRVTAGVLAAHSSNLPRDTGVMNKKQTQGKSSIIPRRCLCRWWALIRWHRCLLPCPQEPPRVWLEHRVFAQSSTRVSTSA